jgi:hypothetical protein
MTTPPPPPPPPTQPASVRAAAFERTLAAFVALMGCLVFAIAFRVDPYDESGRPRTHGTHRQLGLPACHVLSTIGFPCPSCGMTTAVALMLHGDPTAAWRANWAGVFVTAAGGMATAWLAVVAAGVRRPPRFSAEQTILLLTLMGVAVAAVRYVTLVGTALAAGG